VASALIFGLTIERTGLLLSVFLTALTAAAALHEWRRVEALALAAGLSVFAVLLFVVLLRLPVTALP
jgi:putative tricarboxylic transport membrane protein